MSAAPRARRSARGTRARPVRRAHRAATARRVRRRCAGTAGGPAPHGRRGRRARSRDGCSAKNAFTASIRRTSCATWSSSRPSSALAATSASRGRARGRAGRPPREQLVADHDHPLRPECQRRRDRRVEPRRAVHVVARGAQRRGHLDGREQQRDPAARARAGPRGACARTRSHGLSAAAGARSRRTRPAPRARPMWPRRTRRASGFRGDVGVRRVPVDPVLEALRQGRGSSNDAARSPGNSSTSPARRSTQARCRPRSRAGSRCPCGPSASGRGTAAPPLRGERGDRGHDRGVDPADARPAHDLDLLPTRLERREQDRGAPASYCAARPTAGGQRFAPVPEGCRVAGRRLDGRPRCPRAVRTARPARPRVGLTAVKARSSALPSRT